MTFLPATVVLAASTPTNQPAGGQGQEFGSSGPVALILIIALFIAVVFLIRSMAKHLKKVPASFDPPEETTEPAAPAEPADHATVAPAAPAAKPEQPE